MGVRTTLSALTLQASEIAAASGKGQDVVGNLQLVETNLAMAIDQLTVMIASIPAGPNATAFATAVTNLS